MTTYFETGHAKNVAAFEQLISFCRGYGAAFNPFKASSKLQALEDKLAAAKNVLKTNIDSKTAFSNATNSRFDVFDPIKPFSTQLVNAIGASDATPATVNDAKGFNRKIQGKRAAAIVELPANADPNGATIKNISAAQQSYDSLLEHFTKLVSVLLTEPSYQPNEPALSQAGLTSRIAAMEAANTAVIDTFTDWSNNRLLRDDILYNPLTGLVAIAADVKKYIKAVFGATSPQYKQVSSLEFRVIKS